MRDLAADVAKLRLDQDMITAEQALLPMMKAFHFQPAVEALDAAIAVQYEDMLFIIGVWTPPQ